MQTLSEYQDVRVLIADDTPVNQRLMTAILHSLGISPQIVADGAAAVREAERTAFDLILMDISMPVMDGLTAIRRIRECEKQARRARASIYVVSSHHDPRDLVASRSAGADGHLGKPFLVSAFLGAVEDGLKRSRVRARAGASMLRFRPAELVRIRAVTA